MIWLRYFLEVVFNLLSLAILARMIISWLRIDPYHPVVLFINRVTDPFLRPLRDVIPPLGMIDITPIVALIILQLLEGILLGIMV